MHLAAEHFDINLERAHAVCRTCKQVLPWEDSSHLGIFNGHLKTHTPEGQNKTCYNTCPLCEGTTFNDQEVLGFSIFHPYPPYG